MSDFLPDKGPFEFPTTGTRGVRLTNADDGVVRPVGMTYWPNLSASEGRDWLWLFLSLNDHYTLYRIYKSGAVERVKDLPFIGWGEFSYFSFRDPDLLFVPQGNRLIAHDVDSDEQYVVFDAPGAIRQCHSSADGQVHSMTLDGQPAVHRRGEFMVFEPQGEYDECDLDKSGRWFLIKEGAQNRVIDLESGEESIITDAEGALGHSDMGYGYMVGEEDQTAPGGDFRLWQFPHWDRGIVYTTGSWDEQTRYVSHCNAKPGDAAYQQALFCSIQDEIVLAPLDGSMNRRVICPTLVDMNASGGGPDEYWKKPRAVIDPSGTCCVWTANAGTDRLDAFLAFL